MNDDLHNHHRLSSSLVGSYRELVPPIQADPRRALVDGIVADVLASHTIIALRGDRGVGKTNLLHALAGALQERDLPVVKIASASQSPLSVQRLIGDAVGIATTESPGPDNVLQALESTRGVGNIVLLVDNAEDLSVAMFRYIWLTVKLLHFSKTKLHLVLFGGLGRWDGLEHPDMDQLREAADWRIVMPVPCDEPLINIGEPVVNVPFRPRWFPPKSAVAVSLAMAFPLVAALSVAMRQHHTTPSFSAATTPVAGLSVPSVPATTETGSAARVVTAVPPTAQDAAIALPKESSVVASPAALAESAPIVAPPAAMVEPSPIVAPPAALAESPPVVARPAAVPEPARPAKMTMPQRAVADIVSSRPAPRGALGFVLTVQTGDTIPALYAKLYRGLTPPPYKQVVAANPAPLKPGAIVVFPAPPGGWTQR